MQEGMLEEWLSNISAMHMATSAKDGWDRGFEQALDSLYDEALAHSAAGRKRVQKERLEAEALHDYDGVIRALDAAPSSLFMTRPTAQLYLQLSPGRFAAALKRGPHPFVRKVGSPEVIDEKQGGAFKEEVIHWFQSALVDKHRKALPSARISHMSRDPESQRPYLVDQTGAILADGMITSILPADVAKAFKRGAGIRILTLSQALREPWARLPERLAWQRLRVRMLEDALADAKSELADALRA